MNELKLTDRLKAVFAYLVYLLVFTALLPFLPVRLWLRSRKAPAYADRIVERFGFSAIQPAPGGIWIHAVSVGEVLAIAPAIKKLLDRQSGIPITITTTTPTGSERVQALFGNSVSHVYAPYDWPLCVWLFLRKVKPGLAVVVETELWPVTLGMCKLFGVKTLVANARLSAKSARGYQHIRWLIEPALRGVSIAAQHNDDAQRFMQLGAEDRLTRSIGSVKFDIAVSEEQRALVMDLKARLLAGSGTEGTVMDSMRFVWIAASTHEGEDEVVLRAHKALLKDHPDCLLVLVPRHPERFESVAKKVKALGLSLSRRSEGRNPLAGPDQQVLLVDTMGELAGFYGVADIAFVGGSLIPVGGHNYLEASVWGLPVLSGPHRHNFLAIANDLESIGGLKVVRNAEELAAQLRIAIEQPRLVREAGSKVIEFLNNNRGATGRLLAVMDELLV